MAYLWHHHPQVLEIEAQKNLTGDGELSRSSHANAFDLFDKAAFAYKRQKSWELAGDTYVKLAKCHMLMVTQAYVEACRCHEENDICYNEANNKETTDQLALGEDFEKKAEENLTNGYGLNRTKYENAVNLFEEASSCYKLANSWDRAGETYINLANCHLRMVAQAYVEAAHCYKETSNQARADFSVEEKMLKEATSYLEQAVRLFDNIGKPKMVARYCKEIGKLYERQASIERAANSYPNDEPIIEQSCAFYDRAADLYENEDETLFYECKVKVAQFSAKLKQYPKAIRIFEDFAKQSLNGNSLKCEAKKLFLNAGFCHLLESGIAAMTDALERYEELDPTFSGTSDYKFLVDIAAAFGEKDAAKFHNTSRELKNILPLDKSAGDLLSRLKLRMFGLSEDEAGFQKYLAVVKRLRKKARLVK